MKIYYINIWESDGLENWDHEVLHTTNKKQLDDLAKKWTRQHGRNTLTFTVRELKVSTSVGHDDIKYTKRFIGFGG